MKVFVLLFVVTIIHAAPRFQNVRQYLMDHDDSFMAPMTRSMDTPWLKNSNAIGLGYNPLLGSPVCYTGDCRMDGYGRSVFKLALNNPTPGSCTTAQIPDNVELHCISSSELIATTETISTLKELSQSTSNGISFGAGVKYGMFSAGYSYSEQTHFMVDQIVKQETTALFTTGKITFGKLSMFEPSMELSDSFRYVIEEMPCCDSKIMSDYVQEFVIDYFGLTFVTDLMLGGIAQQTVFIKDEEISNLQEKGKDVSHMASVGFYVTFNVGVTSSEDIKEHEDFKTSVQTSRSSKLGGDPSSETMDKWIQSIPTNPIIMNVAVKDITSLLTSHRFPNDSLISKKSELLSTIIRQYVEKERPICHNDCTDPSHGECDINDAYFSVGTCKCQPSWAGKDCSKKVFATVCKQPSMKNKKCVKPKWNSKPITVAGGSRGDISSELNNPVDLALDSNNAMYIVDANKSCVWKWHVGVDQIGQSIYQSRSSSPGWPQNVFLDKNNNIYIMDFDSIQKANKQMNFTTVAGPYNMENSGHSFSVDNEHNIYVADMQGNRVLKWNNQTAPESQSMIVVAGGRLGSAFNELRAPSAIFVDECQNLYIADQGNQRIVQWPQGAAWGTTVFQYKSENYAVWKDIKVDENGNIYVADYTNSSVIKFSRNGEQEVVVSSTDDAKLDGVSCVAFDTNGNMFICDTKHNRIQMYLLESGTFGC